MNLNDPYLRYYRLQHQTGGGITSVYRGAAYQRGHGVGSFLGGLARTIMPLLKSGAAALGKEALSSGVGFLGDISAGTRDPRQAANARLRQFTGGLKRRADSKLERVLQGGGYKKRRITRVTPQSLAKLLRVHKSPVKKRKAPKKRKQQKKRRKVSHDIFT